MSWTAIQLGSREHYAIPIALHNGGTLDRCITDTWLSEVASRLVQPVSPSLSARRSDLLPDKKVVSNTLGRLVVDATLRLRGRGYWDSILERNEWFGDWVARQSAKVGSSTVFSYTYTAKETFAEARSRGARCILGQIDPGPREEDVVLEATKNYRHLAPPSDRAPQKYWDLCREEIAMADKILVNSPWSARLLVEARVDAAKLVEVPLVYELAESAAGSIQSSVNPLVTRHLSHLPHDLPLPRYRHRGRSHCHLRFEIMRKFHPPVAIGGGGPRLCRGLLLPLAHPARHERGHRLCHLVRRRHRARCVDRMAGSRPKTRCAGRRGHGSHRRRRGGDQSVLDLREPLRGIAPTQEKRTVEKVGGGPIS